MESKHINVEGLPEPVVRGLEVVVEMARNLAHVPVYSSGTVPELPVWQLGTIGTLGRGEIYHPRTGERP